MVGSERESKLFLDESDAAYLFGEGDLVWKRGGLVRLERPFVPQPVVDELISGKAPLNWPKRHRVFVNEVPSTSSASQMGRMGPVSK